MALLGALGAAGGAGGALGAISGLVGTVFSAAAANQQAEAQAQAAEYNAKVAEQNALIERRSAEASSEDFRRQEDSKKATAIADLGASGVQIGAGTPLLLLSDIEQEIELGAARIGNTGATRATGFENTATLDRLNASNSRKAGKLAAGASIIGGISKFF